ncbi:MAG: hypothetical protein ACRC3H_24855 [Lachnospiraceae bacterium]
MKLTDLLSATDDIAGKKIVAGFDGFSDSSARLVRKTANGSEPARMFETIREFGEFLISKAEKSCSLEMQVESRHLGGNMPFLSQGASALGLEVASIGMMGAGGEVEEPFRQLPCTLYPFAASAQSTCLEFQDGKVLLAPTCSLPREPWSMVMEATKNKAPELFARADLMALVNWSELPFAQELWSAVYDNALAGHKSDRQRFAFFDLCDIVRKTTVEIKQVLKLIEQFSSKRTTILSLNENEAHELGRQLSDGTSDLVQIGTGLQKKYEIDQILIHTIHKSILVSEAGIFIKDTDFIREPKRSTGAGDHFNAAACFAVVMGLEENDRLLLANRFAGLYVAEGQTPTLERTLMSF